MKIFVYKTLFVVVLIFFLFNLTIGYQIRNIQDKIINLTTTEKINEIKNKIREELASGIKKEKILNEEDKILINSFIKKIINELEIKD